MNAAELLCDLMFDVKSIRNGPMYRVLYTEFHGICDTPYREAFKITGNQHTSYYSCRKSLAVGSESERKFFHKFYIVDAVVGNRLLDPRDVAPAE